MGEHRENYYIDDTPALSTWHLLHLLHYTHERGRGAEGCIIRRGYYLICMCLICVELNLLEAGADFSTTPICDNLPT